MIINRDVIIRTILKYKNDFFGFIDYINHHGEALEFPETHYIRFYNTRVMASADEAEKNILSLESLLESGVFTYRDKLKGHLGLSKIVYDLLIFLDVSRNRELSLAKFESYRQQTEEVSRQLINMPQGTEDYQEQLQLFWELITQILTTVKENIRVLHSKVDEIAERYKKLQLGQEAPDVMNTQDPKLLNTQEIESLYQATQKLHARYVQPCLEFINPDLPIVNGRNFVQAIDDLIDFYRQDNFEELAISIQYKLTAITSYYKDIRHLSERLLSYLYSLAEERRYFMAIEYHFQGLMNTFVSMRHGRRQHRLLTPDLPEIEHMRCFDGLSAHKQTYSIRFNRHPDKALLQFKHYYENLQSKPLTVKKDITQAIPTSNQQHQRKNQVMTAIIDLPRVDQIEDIHQYVDGYLRQNLADFGLLDTLYGLEFFLPLLDKKAIRQLKSHQRLEDEQYYLSYRPLEYRL